MPDELVSVYVMKCETYVKIGIAADPKERMANLQLASPLAISLVYERQFQTRNAARMAERSIHLKFAESRKWGEWFDLEAPVAVAAVQAATEAESPVTIKQRKIVVISPEPKPEPQREQTPVVIEQDGPTFDEFEAMPDDQWIEFMRPVATALDFLNPDRGATVQALRADLKSRYPRFYGRRDGEHSL